MENTNEILNEMQKKISVRDIILVRNKTDDIGVPYLVTFAEQNDMFMCAIRIIPSAKGRNDLIIPSEFFNNPKTTSYVNGGYVNIYTGINTIRRNNVTTWISSIDQDSYMKIIYSLFCGMLGFYTTNGKFRLPQQMTLNFNINVNLLGAIKNSGIQQKNGDIFVPPAKEVKETTNKTPHQKKDAKPNTEEDKSTLQEYNLPNAEPDEKDEESAEKNDDGWNNPPANMPDPVVVNMIFGDDDFIEIDSKIIKRFNLDKHYQIACINNTFNINSEEFIECIAFGKVDLAKIFYENDVPNKPTPVLATSLIDLCNDIYEAAKSQIK